jgi:ankyrin repeat protein
MADNRPLSSDLAGCCKAARSGHGLPESEERAEGTPRPRLFHELVRIIDGMARKILQDREERLLAMHGGRLDETLCDAAEAGGLKDVRFLLARGAHASAQYGQALRLACSNGHHAVAEALLERGAAFSQYDGLDQSLYNAAERGNNACCELLLDHGANVHWWLDGPLRVAAWRGHLQTAALLLDRGASAWSDLAMQSATRNRHDAVVALLLERRAA